MPKDELEDRSLPTTRFRASSSRLSQAWPWIKIGGSSMEDVQLLGRMFSHKGLPGTQVVRPRLLVYLEKHAPGYLTIPKTWEMESFRVDTWSCSAADMPPENPDYEWTQKRPDTIAGPPTGAGAA